MAKLRHKLLALIQPALNYCIRSEKHLIFALLAALLLGALLLAALGYQWYVEVEQQNRRAQQQVQLLQAQQKQTLQSLAKANVSSAVNNHADYSLRRTLEQQQETLDEQERLLEFYSLLMAMGQTKEGLELNGLTITPVDEEEAGSFQYELVFVQYAKRHHLLRAQIALKIVGSQDGETSILNVEDLQSGIDEDTVNAEKSTENVKSFGKLRFKYFQKMQGQLTLPPGFIPEQMVVDAIIKKKKAKPWQRIVDWPTED